MSYLRIPLLDHLPGPDVCSLNGEKDVTLILCDRSHHHIVENRAHEGACQLGSKCTLWAQMCVLRQLEVLEQVQSLVNRIISEAGEVHVCERHPRV